MLTVRKVREVRGMLAPFVLRRLKSGVLKQLVAKTERLELVPLSKVCDLGSFYDGRQAAELLET